MLTECPSEGATKPFILSAVQLEELEMELAQREIWIDDLLEFAAGVFADSL